MKIKDFLELCESDYQTISVYDKSTYTRKLYHYTQEVMSKYGYFTLLSWKLDGDVLRITTRTEF